MSSLAWPLFGHEKAESSFLLAAKSGHLHHGWIIEGPKGVGKATFAMRIAAYMLGAKTLNDQGLDVPVDDNIAKTILSGAHPDLKILSRVPDEKGKVRQDIPVDDVRALNHFFSLKSAMGGWRIGIIDSLDELNRNGSNALLKTLEEPPKNSLLLLVSHGSRRILPTIRSRCRSIRLSKLGEDDTLAALKHADVEDVRAAAKLSGGSPGMGLILSSPAGINAANSTRSFLRALPSPLDSTTAQMVRHAGVDATSFEAFSMECLSWIEENTGTRDELAHSWLDLSRFLEEARALNMDRHQAAAKVTRKLLDAAAYI